MWYYWEVLAHLGHGAWWDDVGSLMLSWEYWDPGAFFSILLPGYHEVINITVYTPPL